ncbi:hypothetical protein PFISCL1PPCAC_19061, partial [Pristionchus fissidentatus]
KKEEEKKERKKTSDKPPPEKEATSPYLKQASPYLRQASPYLKTKDKKDPNDSRGRSVDVGIRNRKKKKSGDKSGKSGRSARTEKEKKRTSGQRSPMRTSGGRNKNSTEAATPVRSPSQSPIHSSPVKTDAAISPLEIKDVKAIDGVSKDKVLSGESMSREPLSKENTEADDRKNDYGEIDMTHADFKTAIKLMEILKRNNILENALFPAQNETLRAFFDAGMKNPDMKILELISKAMDFVLDAVFFKGEDMDCIIDTELKNFIVDRSKSKPLLLDVIISRPEFLPQSWGGRTVVLRQSEATVFVQPDAKRDKGAGK